jgi:hypothetical protein
MKKLLLASVPMFFVAALSAQSFSVTSTTLGTIANGSTVTYFVDQASGLETHDFDVHNISGGAVTAKVRETVLSQASAGSTFYFCTDQNCYPPNTNISNNVPMQAGEDFLLVTDFTPDNTSGTSVVRYTVFNTANTSDSMYFMIEYVVSPTGIQSHAFAKPSLGAPVPNPANQTFTMNYNLGTSFGTGEARLVIYNMLGDIVMTANVNDAEGTLRFEISALQNGVYFTSLEVAGKQVSTKRLIVSH